MNFKNLKEAILNKSWEDVISFYENLTGETLNDTDKVSQNKRGRPKKNGATKKLSKSNKNDDMIFYGGEDAEDNEESKIAKKMLKAIKKKKTKPSRNMYQPDMVNCTVCNKPFDKNKDNSFTIIGESGGVNKNLCNTCVRSR